VLRAYGEPPEVAEFDEPEASDGQVVVEVEAAGLNPVDLRIASGSFYGGRPPLPCVVGREGIGRLADGTLVYFDGPVLPFGAFAARTVVPEANPIPLPAPIDPGVAVALGVAGLAAWLALDWRGQLREGETVIVLGASGVVGQIAVQAARALGAGRVVAAARDAAGLERARALGADATARIGEAEDLAAALREASGEGADLVIDPLWGEPAEAALEACRLRGRLVQIGESASSQATLPSATVRGRSLSILGHTNFVAPAEVRRAAYERMVELAAAGEIEVTVERVPLAEVADAWRRQAESPRHKLVITP
jgi:NADPH2:quinone reductase